MKNLSFKTCLPQLFCLDSLSISFVPEININQILVEVPLLIYTTITYVSVSLFG